MSNYKVRFKASATGWFAPTVESLGIYEADSPQGAIKACREDFQREVRMAGGDPDEDATLAILDVEAICRLK